MFVDPSLLQREKDSFGAWLLRQKDRGGFIGQLAAGAAADRAFPRNGTPDDVRARLKAVMAEGDMYEAVDDAERAYGAYVAG